MQTNLINNDWRALCSAVLQSFHIDCRAQWLFTVCNCKERLRAQRWVCSGQRAIVQMESAQHAIAFVRDKLEGGIASYWTVLHGIVLYRAGHDGLVAQNQPNWKDLNRAQCRGHYWIMRAVQGHFVHFTPHLGIILASKAHFGIILASKENLGVTVDSSIKIRVQKCQFS